MENQTRPNDSLLAPVEKNMKRFDQTLLHFYIVPLTFRNLCPQGIFLHAVLQPPTSAQQSCT